MLYLLFCIFIFVVSTDLNNFLSITFGTSGLLSPLFIGLLLIFLYYGIKFNVKVDRYTKIMLLLFGVWFSYGLLLNIGKPNGFENTFERFRYYLPSVLYLYSLSLMFNKFFLEGKMLNLVKIITIALVINSAIITISSFGFALPLNSELNTDDRLGGLFESVNQAGVVSSFAQTMCLFFVFLEKTALKRALYFGFYLVSLSGAIFTFSKGAFLYSIIIVLIFLYFQTFRQGTSINKVKIGRYFLLGILGIVGYFVFQEMFLQRNYSRSQEQRIDQFTRLLQGEINQETTTNRSRISTTAYDLIQEDFFMGRGIGTFHSIDKLGGLGTHDTYLLILGEIGILGLFIFLRYYFKVWWASFKLKVTEYSFLCISICSILMVASLVSHNVLYVKLYILMFAMINTINNYYVNKKKNLNAASE